MICGFGRTGHYWGSQAVGIRPDILTCAKGLTGAYVLLSATLVNERVYEVIRAESGPARRLRSRLYLWRSHPLAAAVAIAALKRYDEIDVVQRARLLGSVLHGALGRFNDHPLVGEILRIGFMAGVELVADKASRQPFETGAKIGLAVQNATEESGVILRALGDTIVFAPPYVCSNEDVERIVSVFGDALERVYRSRVLQQ